MESQRRAIWIGVSAAQASILCFALLATVPWIASGNAEGNALHALRQSLSDPSQVLQSWDPRLVNPCTWFHITCNSLNLVVRVDLGNASLSGSLVPELGQLSSLQYLEMFKNNISGEIPASLGNLKQLRALDLYQNRFTGEIPAQLGNLHKLQILRLEDNTLTGTIPESLTSLNLLDLLDLSDNDLEGDIPVSGSFARFSYARLLHDNCLCEMWLVNLCGWIPESLLVYTTFEGNPNLHYKTSAPPPC